MNILIFSWRGPGHPNEGGAEQSTHEHAKAWVKAGHKVTLFTSSFDGSKSEEVIDGVTIIRRGGQIIGVQFAAVYWYVFINKREFDLVVDQFHGIPFFTPLFAKTKILGFIHEVATDVWKLNPLPFPKNVLSALIGPIVELLTFKFIYQKIPFMTVSESTKKDLIVCGIQAENIRVIHNGVTVIKQKNIYKDEKKYTALYLGAISRDKGTEDALKIFKEIDNLNNNWQYWLVGKGTEELIANLKKLAKELGLTKKITFWGYVNQKKKFELLAKAHVLINPSVKEGWGLVNIEANSVGTPVLGYNVPGLRDSVKDGITGILKEKGDINGLAIEAVGIVKDKRRYLQIQNNCLNWSKKFKWEKSGQKSLNLIEKL